MLKIHGLQSKSAQLKNNDLMLKGFLPPMGYACGFIGTTGSGKSSLIAELITEFYADIFKKKNIYLFSPTCLLDDMANLAGFPMGNRVDDNMVEKLETLIKSRKSEIKKMGGVEKTEPMLIVFDDISGNKKLNSSKVFIECYTAPRHLNLMVFVAGHKYKAIERIARLNIMSWFIFEVTRSDVKQIYTEQSPPSMNYKDFSDMFKYATHERYSFMTIYLKQPWKTRFRHNLEFVLEIDD
jgi:hypothetical protein